MNSILWILTLLLFLQFPWTFVTAFSPPLSRRLLLSNDSALTTAAPQSTPSSAGCSSISACSSSILPNSRTLTISVVAIFVACILMAFVSLYARRYCIREGNSSYHSMERSVEHRNEALVKSLPVVKYAVKDEEVKKMMKECAVCLCEFENGEMLRLLPACDHLFHKDCIDMWLFSNTTCPLCRLSLLKPKKGSNGTSAHQLPESVDLQPMLGSSHTPMVVTTSA
ncbi:hypothetical protein L7F22_068408 [Adiantum nelumboides]|nr:hypothetical protein [Adiantum nelumboides]